ncbi:Leucine-rich repeat [Cinnamomum micranthum f. kanehirae]|uniref:Leucine-rich repeat n=1 Tax=Cinnamomum micranthum f. kanehirae TaxID=337451 RepID=A0A443N1H3_9MAGN|nr:Leucine-rich repeat [Cinnamomum micranthum f. kanehirae]
MDEVWERAVETALDGQTDSSSARSLTLDGAVKCIHGRLPPSGLLERFRSLEHLSIANVGVSSLEKFPHLPNLQKLTLSDNRIAGGLEFLVEAGLASLRDLDLSNNRIQFVEDLSPLAQLRLVSLDLYECPVTRVKDYRSRVFSMIRSLKYLDKMDADENERPESDEEDEEEDEEEEEDDPGSGEVDGEDRSGKPANGGVSEGVVDVDEDEESDADEEETETTRVANGSSRLGVHLTNGFRVAAAAAPSADGDDVEEDMEDEDEDDLGEEIDEEEGEDDDVVEVHEIDDSDEDEDGVEEDDEDDEEDEEDVDDEEDMEPGSTAQLTSAEGEIDGHEQGEEDENGEIGEEDDQAVEEDGEYEDDDEENGEIGEEDEQGVEENGEYEEDDGEGEDEEEDFGSEYLVRPVRQAEEDAGGSDLDPGNEDEGEEDEVEDEEDKLNVPPQPKRRRPDGSIEDSRPPPKHPKHH